MYINAERMPPAQSTTYYIDFTITRLYYQLHCSRRNLAGKCRRRRHLDRTRMSKDDCKLIWDLSTKGKEWILKTIALTSMNVSARKCCFQHILFHHDLWQGCHSPVMIEFPDFSLTFPDILREHLLIIYPLNSSDINKCTHFSLPHSYILTYL